MLPYQLILEQASPEMATGNEIRDVNSIDGVRDFATTIQLQALNNRVNCIKGRHDKIVELIRGIGLQSWRDRDRKNGCIAGFTHERRFKPSGS